MAQGPRGIVGKPRTVLVHRACACTTCPHFGPDVHKTVTRRPRGAAFVSLCLLLSIGRFGVNPYACTASGQIRLKNWESLKSGFTRGQGRRLARWLELLPGKL